MKRGLPGKGWGQVEPREAGLERSCFQRSQRCLFLSFVLSSQPSAAGQRLLLGAQSPPSFLTARSKAWHYPGVIPVLSWRYPASPPPALQKRARVFYLVTYSSAAAKLSGDAVLQSSPCCGPPPPPGSICQDGSSSERCQRVGLGRLSRQRAARWGRGALITAPHWGKEDATHEYSEPSPCWFLFIPLFLLPVSSPVSASCARSKEDCHR